MTVSLRCDCAFFLEKLAIIKCCLWLPESVARQLGSNYGFYMPSDIEKTIKEYCDQIENLHDNVEQLEKLKTQLSEQEAVDLWEQV